MGDFLPNTQALWYAIAVVDVLAIGTALLRLHGVNSTLAWIFFILAFPGVGALIYFTFAAPYIRRTPVRARRRRHPLGPADTSPRPEAVAVLPVVERLTRLPRTHGNRVELLARDPAAYMAIERALSAAKTSIWAEYFIIQNDETGLRFMDTLIERAQAGVEVRLLFDAVGTWWFDRKRLKALREAGARVEAFLPVNPFRRRWSAHLRNHRKLVVIDGEIGFTGGMNVGDEYSGRAFLRGGRHFTDTHLTVRGPAVSDLAQIFADDWSFATDERLQAVEVEPLADGTSTVAIVPSGPDQVHNASAMAFFTGVATARSRAWLTSPYFIPDAPLLRALSGAALGGCDVRVLVPATSDQRLVRAAARSFYRELLRCGVRIFEYQPTMLHAKTMVVDSAWCMVGSANIDIRSFKLNFELGALIADATFAAQLEALYLHELTQSVEIDAEAWRTATLPRRLMQGAARLFAPLL